AREGTPERWARTHTRAFLQGLRLASCSARATPLQVARRLGVHAHASTPWRARRSRVIRSVLLVTRTRTTKRALPSRSRRSRALPPTVQRARRFQSTSRHATRARA